MSHPPSAPSAKQIDTDILIVGGTTGGVAAAIACASVGARFVVVESTDWLGGQLTAQGVPPDENTWIEDFGGTRTYQRLREAVRALTLERGAAQRSVEPFGAFNPGGGWVSRCCAEPRLFAELLAKSFDREAWHGKTASPQGSFEILLNFKPISADVAGDSVRAVSFAGNAPHNEDQRLTVTAKFIIDATDLGDVYELAGIEHSIGAEHQSVYNELHGRTDFSASDKKLDWLDQQAVSWCFAVEHRPGETHTIAKPDQYDFWAGYRPAMSPPWVTEPPEAGPEAVPGRLFSWTVPSHSKQGYRTFGMTPWPDEPAKDTLEMWRYRRIVDRSIWPAASAAQHPDVSLINMVQMDYWLTPLLGVSHTVRQRSLQAARELSASWLYWMQTAAPRHDGQGLGYPGLRLRGDELGTADGFAKACYIREPRRLLARTMVTEAHVGTAQRLTEGQATDASNWSATEFGTAHRFADTVGIGHYMIDLHPSCAMRNNVYVPCAPFRIPMGALIPQRMTNVLAGGKAMGVSHITNAAYRMHATEWNVGESAGTLAAWCARYNLQPAAIHESPEHVEAVQRALVGRGVRIAWPWEGS